MRQAFLFPGQGSQSVGMGKRLAESFSQARAVFEEVDETLKQKLSRIMFEGPEEELTLTANVQPALMAVSIAIIKVMESSGFSCSQNICYVAGHSLGEYSALCAIGALSLSDTARLLRIRGNAMQKAVPIGLGAMVAIIGLDETILTEICTEVSIHGICQIANDNGGGQLVLSGMKEAVICAVTLAKKRGAKHALVLPVSAPFHSVLMKPAAKIMQAVLKDITFLPLQIPVVTNVFAKPIQDIDMIRTSLVEQITGRVRWRETIQWLTKAGVLELYEIGTGRVLTGLSKRIDKSIQGFSVNNAEELKRALCMLNL